ncbi:HXXEE domain-containing protein [Phocaeicola dorei]|uniref:HXXEE domain-containing protein n=1 Tax=Phocaeicola dorei TaxID=357276 RepID=UPI001C38CA37|nr:HXXEE domain-containing protein [Phocaeicola dorei]MBV4239320.1 HXXEE domain-containing protein [Phocaeicola dorei]MCB6462064.1 HXXEE domain-containing protein [Phocaeicola dorei]MCB6747403.1 HXXEE domain-containing protein [Phocaeicola dorei]MCB6772810.1 HXXEE domain-containing protein [Phocaeicola dorei]MCB6791741.1 HXXEE domain-containing protein [Phocaeicola dorei]
MKKLNDTYLMRNWYNINGVVGILTIIIAIILWKEMSLLQGLAVLNFGVLNLHVFEEFRLPGGFPKFANTMFAMKDSPHPDRYPLNRMSALLTNWITALVLYLPSIIWPDAIWFGLAPILFGGAAQLLMHGVYNNILLKRFYNAGLCAVVFGHVPIMIVYIHYIVTHNMVTAWDWVWGVAIMVVWYIVGVRLIINKAFEDINSPYPFNEEEMRRFKAPQK